MMMIIIMTVSQSYLVGESLCGLNRLSFDTPFRTGVVGIEFTWCANLVPSRRLILRRASARVAFKHTSSSPCSRTRLSRSETRTTTPRLSASSISSGNKTETELNKIERHGVLQNKLQLIMNYKGCSFFLLCKTYLVFQDYQDHKVQ